ncbi:MAG TPA: VOC family protein [Solirubrobacteraceae bacterium]|nr:VOC family protein [Solirubrobacteraceae bacterium]
MAVQATGDQSPKLAAATAIGTVQLTVANLERSRAFYENVLGLRPQEQPDGSVLLGGAARLPPLLSLVGDSAAPPRNPRQTGLYHFALLVPTRRDLAVALVRLAQAGWSLDGASDHLVSEALYLTDPEGNGIEIYADRDRAVWRFDGDGRLEMATLQLDLDGLLAELNEAPPDPVADALMADGTRIGHVHLQVAELEQIERFYAGVLGFDVMVKLGGTALFVSAGGYHHHLGLNTWQSRGGTTPPAGGVGLRAYEIRLGDSDALARVLARVQAAGIATEPAADGATLARDPSGNGILLRI